MHKKRFSWLLWSIILAIPACSSDNPTGLRDTKAAAIIQERWNEAAGILTNLGPVRFRQSDISFEPHAPISEYPMYQASARMRLIKLENVFEAAGADRIALTPAGVPQSLTVSLTPEGEKFATIRNVKNSRLRFAAFQCGEYRVETIISNQPLQIYGDKSARYRAVLGTHVFELKPEFREMCLAHGESDPRERRFRALLKHDPLLDKWSLEVSDVGPREADFESSNVPLMLAKLRADRRFGSGRTSSSDSPRPEPNENEVNF
jgi:hypothetical protein